MWIGEMACAEAGRYEEDVPIYVGHVALTGFPGNGVLDDEMLARYQSIEIPQS